MAVATPQPYNNYELARIEQKLTQDFERGEPLDFEVWIDGLRVIRRTADLEQFSEIGNQVVAGRTKEVRIKIFLYANQTHNDTIILIVDDPKTHNQAATLEGIETRIDSRLKQEKERWAHDLLVKEHDAVVAERDKLLEQLEEASDELEEFRGKKLHLGNINLAELGGVFLEGFIRRNPQVLAKLPGGQALAGVIIEDNENQILQEQANPQAEISFSRADPNDTSPEDGPYLELLKRIQSSFSQADFVQVMEIMDCFISKPVLIPLVADLIEDETNPQTATDQVPTQDHDLEPNLFDNQTTIDHEL